DVDEAVLDRVRLERLLADELDEVGERLQQALRPGAIRPVAVLHPAEQLPLEPGRVGERDHHEVDDHEGLDDRDPPGLAHSLLASTGPECSPAAWSAGTSARPSRRRLLTFARSATEVPFDRTVTVSPFAIPRARASARESSTCAPGRWNCSSGMRKRLRE